MIAWFCDNSQDNEASTFNVVGPPIPAGFGNKTILEYPLFRQRLAPICLFRLHSGF
jgi:hypothetical protein